MGAAGGLREGAFDPFGGVLGSSRGDQGENLGRVREAGRSLGRGSGEITLPAATSPQRVSKLSFSICLDVYQIPASASTNQGTENGGLIPL